MNVVSAYSAATFDFYKQQSDSYFANSRLERHCVYSEVSTLFLCSVGVVICLQTLSLLKELRTVTTTQLKENLPGVIMQDYTKAVKEFVEEHPTGVTAVLVTCKSVVKLVLRLTFIRHSVS